MYRRRKSQSRNRRSYPSTEHILIAWNKPKIHCSRTDLTTFAMGHHTDSSISGRQYDTVKGGCNVHERVYSASNPHKTARRSEFRYSMSMEDAFVYAPLHLNRSGRSYSGTFKVYIVSFVSRESMLDSSEMHGSGTVLILRTQIWNARVESFVHECQKQRKKLRVGHPAPHNPSAEYNSSSSKHSGSFSDVGQHRNAGRLTVLLCFQGGRRDSILHCSWFSGRGGAGEKNRGRIEATSNIYFEIRDMHQAMNPVRGQLNGLGFAAVDGH